MILFPIPIDGIIEEYLDFMFISELAEEEADDIDVEDEELEEEV